MRRIIAIITLLVTLSAPSQAADYLLTVYGGRYTDNKLGKVLVSDPIAFEHANLGVLAIARAFALRSPAHRWEVEGQIGKHFHGQSHWELNAVAIYRWLKFPWNHYLNTTMAVGDGVSYATDVPPLERASTSNQGARRLLNYILVETTFAPPRARNWSLVTRVHHRSGVYGVFGDVRGGSNIVAVGIKVGF
jgi:hypothetical protein